MNKKNLLYVIIGVFLIALSSAGLFYGLNKLSDKKKKEAISTDIIFTKETLPRIDGSTATQPLIDAFILNFTGKTTTEMEVSYTNTHQSYVKLINNEVDLIVVTEPREEELQLAKEKGLELEVTALVNEGFVFFVNKENSVNNLKLDEIRNVYKGEITNWKEFGGNDADMVVYQRPTNSGSKTGLLSLVMNGLEVKVPTSTETIATMAGIVDIVSDYDNGIHAIGYSYYYYANVMYKNDNLKYLAIDGIEPNYTTIQKGSYPLRTKYYIVTRKG